MRSGHFHATLIRAKFPLSTTIYNWSLKVFRIQWKKI